MTPAVSAPTTSGRARVGGRVQGALAIAVLVAAVVVTVVLVTSPPSSAGPGPTGGPSGTAGDALPEDVRVEVRGGDAMAAYGLADRLAGAGASVRAVDPAAPSAGAGESTMIVYYDRRSLAAAERIQSMLGSGTLQRRQAFRPEADVTIVLGKDTPRL